MHTSTGRIMRQNSSISVKFFFFFEKKNIFGRCFKSARRSSRSFWGGHNPNQRGQQIEGGGKGRAGCDGVYCWRDSHPTDLISLFVIKNYSRTDTINLPTQPYPLHGPPPTSMKKWACAPRAQEPDSLSYCPSLRRQNHRGCFKGTEKNKQAYGIYFLLDFNWAREGERERESECRVKEDIGHVAAISVESIASFYPLRRHRL